MLKEYKQIVSQRESVIMIHEEKLMPLDRYRDEFTKRNFY
jgi:hypothetical protein